MAAPVLHQFSSAKADGPDVTLVQPGDWNANHKATGGSPGQAVGWDAAASPEQLGWVRFDHLNYAFNGDMEIWGAGVSAAPSGWRLEGAGASVARDTTNKKYGSASASLTRAGTDCRLAQDISLVWNNLNGLAGKRVAIGCWVKCATGAVARLSITDGVGITNSSYHTGGGAFEFLKVERVLNASPTIIEVRLGIDTGNATAQFDGAILIVGGAAELDDYSISTWQGRKCVIAAGANAAQTQATTEFYGPWGKSATEVEVSYKLPYRGVARKLRVLLDSAPAGGQTATATLRKDEATDTALTAQVTSAGRDASDTTNEVELTANQTISVKNVLSATSGSKFTHVTLEYEEIPNSF